jgi:glycerol-1-phosphate dehydrogenase [NAD(P)+]
MYLEHPQDILHRRPAALAALFEALLLTGVAMTMAQTSSPASGAEHMISHTLDMRSYMEGAKHDLHGRQVGVGTVLAAELYRRVLAQDRPDWRAGPSGIDEAFWGPLAEPAAKEYQVKRQCLGEVPEKLRGGGMWERLRAELSPMLRRPEDVHNCLAGAKAAVTAGDLGFSKDQLRAAMLHAHEFRSRFTILDVAWMAGVLPAAAGEIVEQWG